MNYLDLLKEKKKAVVKKDILVKIKNQEDADEKVEEVEEIKKNEDFVKEIEETEQEEEKEVEKETDQEKKQVQIIDKRKQANIDRNLILNRLRKPLEKEGVVDFLSTQPKIVAPPSLSGPVLKEQEKEDEKPVKKNPVKRIFKVREELLEEESEEETEKEPEKEPEKESEKESEKEPGQKIVLKIKKPRKKMVGQEIQKDVDIEDIVIKNIKLKNRLPKPTQKYIYKTSSYYMNNRKLSIEKLNKLFQPYHESVVNDVQNITCKSLREARNKNVDFELLTHQKVIRDYLNIYTPYRGLLLYFSLGSGKTCSSIAIAEGLKSDKQIYIMTPASLKMNFFDELKKCGDRLYRKNQYWEFVSTEGQPEYLHVLSKALSIPLDTNFIQKNKGAWLVDITKTPNFSSLSSTDQKIIDEQLNIMIRSKYRDINYNGLDNKKVDELSQNGTINPFDHSVVIIDEVHNFVSRIVGGIKSKKGVSYKLYLLLMKATDVRVVLLTGTPIINYPNEIGILYNILRGYIRQWSFPLNIKTSKKVNRDTILEMFQKANFNTYDYVEYSGDTLIVTRNPYGFVNSNKISEYRKKGGALKATMKKRTKRAIRNTKRNKPSLEEDFKNKFITVETSEKLEKTEIPDDIYAEDYRKELLNVQNAELFPGMKEAPIYGGDEDSNVFESYNGVKLDETGNVSDLQFKKEIIKILNENGIEVYDKKIKIDNFTALPDNSKEFLSLFVDNENITLKNEDLFKRRILGLTSYFRSTQETLLPKLIKNDKGNTFTIVPCEMSDYQFTEYSKIRKVEADKEKQSRKSNKINKNKDAESLFNIASVYRVRSRACCNFAFPKSPARPQPSSSEKDVDNEDFEDDFDEEEIDMNDTENMENKSDRNRQYLLQIQRTLEELETRSVEFFIPEELEQYSPKFLRILENITNEENVGLHLVYSQFRTLEGIGILKLVLETNGYAQLKIKKVGSEWIMDIKDTDKRKPKFILYTGTETTEEKDVLLKIYNSEWNVLQPQLQRELEKIHENNYYGEIAKVLMITSSGAEGINLKNTRFVHIVEPYWHMVRLDQVVGRARRICSHEFLPEEMQTVKVFLYMAAFTDQQKKDETNKELLIRDISKFYENIAISTDESLYEISQIKDNLNQQILKSIKESAIDCNLYSVTRNKDKPNYEKLVCYGYGKVDTNEFGSFPDLSVDVNVKSNLDIKKVKRVIQIIKQGDTEYALDKKTMYVYDYESYQRNKDTGSDMIYVGRLVKRNKEFIIDRTVKEAS
jgi:hypothetical protein